MDQQLLEIAEKESRREASLNPLAWLLGNVTESEYLETIPQGGEGTAEYQKWRLAHFISSNEARIAIMVMITANAIAIGLETDQHSTAEVWMSTLSFFAVVFAVEVSLV